MTQSEYIRHSGLSKGQVSKLVAKGMPLTSPEAADQWRGMGAKRRPGPTPPPAPEDSGPYRAPEAKEPGDPSSIVADTPQGAYERMRNLERATYALAVNALKARQPDAGQLVSIHARHTSNLITARIQVLELAQKERELVSGDWVRQQMVKHDGAVATLLRAMPKQLASRIAPHDPAHAEQELERWVQEVALKTLNSTSPWPEESVAAAAAPKAKRPKAKEQGAT